MHGLYVVVRALQRVGAVAHLAEVTETRALRGRKRRANTDRADARWLRQLLSEGRLPEAWIAPITSAGCESARAGRGALSP